MYSSKYSQVSKYSPEARKRMQHRSRGKSCGYYMRIVFFFSSLIQSLIIVSLVLFLIYGKKQDSPSTSRIHDLEESFSQLSIENLALKQQRQNLTTFLNTTLTEKARNDWDLAKLRDYTNISVVLIQDMDKRMLQCAGELMLCRSQSRVSSCPQQLFPNNCNCGMFMEQLRARLSLVESNFTQTVQRMRMDMDQITKERDNLNLEVIRLRRDKSTHEKEVEIFRKKCKTDFSESLSGISNVTKAFLEKIDSLFPVHIAFQLTCPKQREHLEQIRTNCTSLSREVEDRFQLYLNSVGDKVTSIQSESSRLRAENWRLSEDYRWCSQNRTGLIQRHKQSQEQLQLKHDQDKEKLLIAKMKLHGEIEVLQRDVKYKTTQVEHLVEQLKHLNMTCMSRGGFSGIGIGQQPRQGQGIGSGLLNGGGSSLSSSSSLGQYNRQGSGTNSNFASGSAFNRQAPSGPASAGSSLFSSGSSNSGYGQNRQASSSSSSSSLFSSGSSSSSGYGSNKPASSSSSSSSLFSSGSSSSSGYGSNKPASSGSGSSLLSSGSSGSSSSSGYGSNKPASTGSASSSSSLLSSGSSGSSSLLGYGSSKPASSASSSSLFSSGPSSSGSNSNKPASTGSSSSSLFSSGSSSSTGYGSNKPASTGGSPSSYGSSASSSSSGRGSSASTLTAGGKTSSGTASSSTGSSGSTGSTSKSSSSSSGLGWFNSWGSSSSSGQSKTGSGTGKGTSSGSGSSIGSGRTSGLGGGSVSVAQHLRDLQRLINPAAPEEKQDLSKMLG